MDSHDSLPYIDQELSQLERDKAESLVARELPGEYSTVPHPSLPEITHTKISKLIEQEINRIQTGGTPKVGIDLSRYEAPDQPTGETDSDTWRTALRNAYISRSYLSNRHLNLNLLDESGKNAWLVGNSQIEEVDQRLDRELANLKTEIDQINRARKSAQEGSKAELLNLEETWKNGIGKTVEVQLATEALRQELSKK